MRLAALTVIGSLAIVSAAAMAAPTIPAAPAPAAAAKLVQASWHCGPAYHPDARSYCVPNRYYGKSAWYPSYYRFYYAWGQPYPRHWHQ